MTINTHATSDHKIAEIITEEIILSSTEDALDLIGNLSYQGFDKIMPCSKLS
jgi:hypothetical protein